MEVVRFFARKKKKRISSELKKEPFGGMIHNVGLYSSDDAKKRFQYGSN